MTLPSRRIAACLAISGVLGAFAAAVPARAQTDAPDPRDRYQRELARCNRGMLPAPAREACVRQAGQAFDRATGGITGTQAVTSPDGRATVMEPFTGEPGAVNSGLKDADGAAPLVTTPDGRATVVNPSAP